MSTLLICVLITLIFILYVHYVLRKLNYWNLRGVPNNKPVTPLGDLINCFVRGKNMFDVFCEFYNKFKRSGHRYAGFYFTTGPILIIIDKDLIKRVLVNDYDHFNSHGMYGNKEKLYLSGNVMCAESDKWKLLRDMINHVSSTSKSNKVLPITEIYAKKFIDTINFNINESINIFNIYQRYIVDVASNFYMGLDQESFTDDVPMTKYAQEISDITWTALFELAFNYGTTNPADLFLAALRNDNVTNFFKKHVEDTYKLRKERNIKRDDAFGHFIERYENDENFDFQDLVCQIFFIFGATFDTISFSTTYALYEIARSAVYQEKLRKEIVEKIEKYGEINYECLNDMQFLDDFVTGLIFTFIIN